MSYTNGVFLPFQFRFSGLPGDVIAGALVQVVPGVVWEYGHIAVAVSTIKRSEWRSGSLSVKKAVKHRYLVRDKSKVLSGSVRAVPVDCEKRDEPFFWDAALFEAVKAAGCPEKVLTEGACSPITKIREFVAEIPDCPSRIRMLATVTH